MIGYWEVVGVGEVGREVSRKEERILWSESIGLGLGLEGVEWGGK